MKALTLPALAAVTLTLVACGDSASDRRARADAQNGVDQATSGLNKTGAALGRQLNAAADHAKPAVDRAGRDLNHGVDKLGVAAGHAVDKAGAAINHMGDHAQAAAARNTDR